MFFSRNDIKLLLIFFQLGANEISYTRNNQRWTVGWGFTSLCDLHCSFCYSAPVRPARGTAAENNLDQAIQFLKRNGKDIRAINFGTGESFLSPVFPDLLDLCVLHAPDAEIAVTTNGAFAELPAATQTRICLCLRECDISIDFSDEEAHDRWRGKAGAWQRAIKAAKQAKTLGLKTSIVMVGTRQTLTEENLKGLMTIASDIGTVLRVNMYMPTFGDFSFAASAESVWSAIRLLSLRCSNILSSDRLFAGFLGQNIPENRFRSCRILPDGSISPSTYLISKTWYAAEKSDHVTLSLLSRDETFRKYAEPPIPAACKPCEKAAVCRGGSVERRWLWTGLLDHPDPLCPICSADCSPDMFRELDSGNLLTWDGPTIHLDYLPTIIVIPQKHF